MGKQGPCCHCGISTTPLWRNGPPEKPVLCNACGSRWRTKGTLANYMPMHSGGCGANASLEYRWPRGKKTSQKIKEQKSYKKKEPYDILHDSEVISSNQHYVKNLEEDASTRSSSVSCLSYSEGSMHHPVPYDRYNTVTGHSSVWDSPVPSRKRTCMSRQRPSSLDKLTKSVHVPQGHESSYFSGSSEENLLYESRDTMDISEIGLGGVFVRQSNSFAREEESEASSLLIDSKGYNVFDNTHLCVGAGENTGQIHGAHVKAYDQCRAVKDLKRVMQCCHPPLVSIVLEDVFNFETFMETFKAEEQQWLMKYLSSVDVFEVPGSLKHMFESSQFKCALSHFQHLLSEDVFGIFDSDLQVNQLFQLLLIVIDLISSKWLERYSNFKKHNRSSDDIRFSKLLENKRSGKTKGFGGFASSLMKTGSSLPDKEITNFTGQPLCHDNTEMCTWSTANNERSRSAWANSRTDGISHESTDTGSTSKEADADHKSISSTDPNSLFISNNGSCATLIFDSLCDFTDDDSDSVLLFNVPANLSFPQAELLHAPVFSRQPSSATNVTRAEGGSSDVQPEKNELNFEQCSEWSDVIWSPKGTESSKITPGDTIIHPSGT